MLSIIIPARGGQPYLQRTIDDLLAKAEGEIEIIVVLDGIWPDPPVKQDKRVVLLHHGTQFENRGMKESINRGIAISKGKYIMKTDAHCMFDQGFDVKLAADCEDNQVVIPRRWRLDGDEWKLTKDMGDTRPPVDYMYLAYPYERPFDKTCGLHGAEWRERTRERESIQIDNTMSFQGSCWFTTRLWFDYIMPDGFDSKTFGNFTMEAQEIGNKTWFNDGYLVVNKKTYYAHMHKGKRGKQYQFSNKQYDWFMRENEKGRLAGIKVFLQDPRFEKLLESFWPVPGWKETWKEDLIRDEKSDYSHSKGYDGI